MKLLKKPEERYLLVINPVSRMGKGLRKAFWLIARLVLHRVDFDAVLTKRTGHAERIVADYEAPVDTVVAIGGDGTIQEIINGLMKRERRPSLAVMPAGRGNDFSSLIGIGRSKRRALKYMLGPEITHVDLLKLNGRYAGNQVGIGYDAMVQEKSSRYKHWPVIRYLKNAVTIVLRGVPVVPMKIHHVNGTLEGEFLLANVGHTRKYAREIRLFPGLRIDGGVMKVAAVRSAGKMVNLVMLFAAGVGLAGLFPYVTIIETPRVEIEVGATAKAQSDGDLFYIGKGEVLRVELLRQALAVKTPFGNK